MKEERLEVSMIRLIIAVTLIVCIGALMGVTSYLFAKGPVVAIPEERVPQDLSSSNIWKN